MITSLVLSSFILSECKTMILTFTLQQQQHCLHLLSYHKMAVWIQIELHTLPLPSQLLSNPLSDPAHQNRSCVGKTSALDVLLLAPEETQERASCSLAYMTGKQLSPRLLKAHDAAFDNK